MSSLVESLYYQTYNSVLLGDTQKAKMFLSFLREEYDANEDQFGVLKSDERWQHLMNLGNAIDNNLILSKKLQTCNEQNFPLVKQEEETTYSKQQDLVKAIILCQDDLRMFLGAESDFHCSCVEAETRFGRVDLVAQDKFTIFPIEVKKNGAFHDVLGQINKYIIHYELGLINRTYQKVTGIVIANSFDNYVLQEIRNFNAIAVKYTFKSEQKVEFTGIL